MDRKARRDNIRCKRYHYYRPLNLPENIWRQYEKSLIESSQPQHNVMPTSAESETQLCTKDAKKDIVKNREELSLENLISVNERQVSIKENQTNNLTKHQEKLILENLIPNNSSEIEKNMNIFTYSDKDMSLSLNLQEMGKEDEIKNKELLTAEYFTCNSSQQVNNLFEHISDKEIIESLNEMEKDNLTHKDESTDDLIPSNLQPSHKNIFVPLSGKEILEMLEDDSRNICDSSLLKNLVGDSKDENKTTMKPVDNCITKKQQKKQLSNNKREKKQKQITEKQKVKNLMIKQDLEQKNNVFKLLSVKVDHFSTVDVNCLLFNNRLKESIELHKNIYENMLGAKEILTNCSIRQVIHLKDQNNLFSNHIISADAKLDNTFTSLRKLELLLSYLQQHFYKISIPFSLLNYYNIEDNDLQRMTELLKDKQNEIEILKQKNSYLQNELQSNHGKLIKTKRNCKKHISETDKKFSEMKNKLCFFRKRLLRLSVEEDNRKNIINNFDPTQFRMQQLQDLISLTNTVMANILNDQGKVNLSQNTTYKNSKIINNLKSEIRDLKKQNKQKDNEIQSLTKAGNRARRQVLLIKQKKKIEDEQKQCEINKLTSTLNDLQRKHDRWLLDKFHQKCHSIMLFEKIKQLELQQHKMKET